MLPPTIKERCWRQRLTPPTTSGSLESTNWQIGPVALTPCDQPEGLPRSTDLLSRTSASRGHNALAASLLGHRLLAIDQPLGLAQESLLLFILGPLRLAQALAAADEASLSLLLLSEPM